MAARLPISQGTRIIICYRYDLARNLQHLDSALGIAIDFVLNVCALIRQAAEQIVKYLSTWVEQE